MISKLTQGNLHNYKKSLHYFSPSCLPDLLNIRLFAHCPSITGFLAILFFFFKAVSYAWNALLSLFPHCCMTRPTTPSTLFSNVIFSRWPSLTNSFYIETLLQPLEFLIPLIFLYSLFTGIFQELEQCLTFSRSLWNICVFEWTKCWI